MKFRQGNTDLIDSSTDNLSRTPTLSSGTNLDELRSDTSFRGYWANGANITGDVPYSDYFWIFILPSGNVQILIPYNGGSTAIYLRTYTNNRWYGWRSIAVTY